LIRSVVYGLVLVFASASWAQAPPPVGAVVQTSHYDAAINMVTLTIANVSHKDITAYNIAIKETYADGQVHNHELMADYVGRIAFVKELQGTVDEDDIRKQFGDGLFHSGETRQEMVGVQPGFKDIRAVVDVVAYADQTAEATNADGLKRIVDHRKSEIAATQLANQIIQTALADPNDADPAATAAKKVQERLTLWNVQKHTALDLDMGGLQGTVNELKEISSQKNKRDALNQYVAKREQRITMMSPHSVLTKTGGPQ
jgi:hypothetical protein